MNYYKGEEEDNNKEVGEHGEQQHERPLKLKVWIIANYLNYKILL